MNKICIFFIIIIIFFNCSMNNKNINNIEDWMPEYKINDIYYFELQDSIYTHLEQTAPETISVDNRTLKIKQFTETIKNINSNESYTIISIYNEGMFDSNFTYYLIIDKIRNRLIISNDTISDLNDIIILNTPIDSLAYWSTYGFDGNIREYTIIDDKVKEKIGEKYYYELIHILSNNIDNSIEEFYFSSELGLIYRYYTIKEREELDSGYVEYTHKMKIIFQKLN